MAFDSCKDHKHVNDCEDNVLGGGSGAISPHPSIARGELAAIVNQIIVPLHAGCLKDGPEYCGPVFPGIILTKEGPRTFECNARFDDPET